jgi:archaemetzincin
VSKLSWNHSFIGLILIVLIASCSRPAPANRVVVVQPFGDFDPVLANKSFQQIRRLFQRTLLRPSIKLPESAWYAPRARYRADELLRVLQTMVSGDTVIIGMTSKDISTTKDGIKDWGIMGLGYRPGDACVVSTYRLAKVNLGDQFIKVAIHELGHTQGLPHCPVQTCFMRDAKGGNPLNEETGFCSSCKSFLIQKGWKLENSR